jgi:hypothetical protein
MKKALLILVACPILAYPQTRKQKKALEQAQIQADTATVMNLRAHVQYLSDDQLEGRRAGTQGELLAMQYISTQFKKAGIEPKGTSNFEQEFAIAAGKQLPVASNTLEVNEQPLSLHNDFFPLAYAASLHAEGDASPCLREKGEPWFWDVKDALDDNKDNPHFNIYDAIRDEAAKATKKGAKALLVFNSSKQADHIHFNKRDTTAAMLLPVLYITAAGWKKYFTDPMATYSLRVQVEIQQPSRTGRNVVGYINNNAVTTIILGAHYDHLGYGEDGNALDGQGQIHNGADDNASGTAALIELARLLKISNDRNNNYLFIAFSGEELGLLGSKYWLDHPSVTIHPNYMINMDMIGRYNSAKPLTIGGYGTSSAWATVLQNIPANTLAIRFDSTGAGPSDHASFYRKDIPVLFFFTNGHEDYHKAGDDWNKINYTGELAIVKYIQQVIAGTGTLGKLPFVKTKEADIGPVNLPVTLGIMPDYAFSGTGVRIDGVSKGKLAEGAGLETGDILLQLGDQRFTDVTSYMQALRTFKKGDKTTLRFQRGTTEKTVALQF